MTDPNTTRELRPGAGAMPPLQDRSPPRQELPAPDAEGELVLDRYRLERLLGRGGHGAVWEALDERLERRVAVKAIRRGEDSIVSRAEREGRVAARLNHPGIVGLYEFGADERAIYLVSELVHGKTMAELGRAGALSDRDVSEIGLAVGAALEHAHARGVVHRDVKPQNVIVVAEPAAGAGFAKLTDFGVAHVADEVRLTRTGDVVGTLAYMAPEQAEGGEIGPASDLYSLALVLYEGWTGSGPESAVAARLAGRPPAPLRRLRRDLPSELCRVIDGALDPRPYARPGLADLQAALRAAVDDLSERGGLVEPATRRRFGIPSAAAVRARSVPGAPTWVMRAAAGAAAGSLVLGALASLAPPPGSTPAVLVGAAVAVLVALLPRLGWILAAGGVLAWFAAPDVGERGTALVLAPALAAVPVLLPRAGLLWSVPALAPLLGAIGLAPLFVAIAGAATTVWRRAALAVAGFGWLVTAELLTGRTLLYGVASDVTPPGAWDDSPLTAAREAIYPTVTSLALLPAAAWAVLAVGLGLLVFGRRPAIAIAGAVVWAIAAVAAHRWLADLLAASVPGARPGGTVAGVVLGALGALVVAQTLRRERSDATLVP